MAFDSDLRICYPKVSLLSPLKLFSFPDYVTSLKTSFSSLNSVGWSWIPLISQKLHWSSIFTHMTMGSHSFSCFLTYVYVCMWHVLVCHGNAGAWARGGTGVTDGCEPPIEPRSSGRPASAPNSWALSCPNPPLFLFSSWDRVSLCSSPSWCET